MTLLTIDVFILIFVLLFSTLVFQSIRETSVFFKFFVFVFIAGVVLVGILIWEFDIQVNDMDATGYVTQLSDICLFNNETCKMQCQKIIFKLACRDICNMDECLPDE